MPRLWRTRSVPGALTVDVSYFQATVDNSYPHPWFIFRGAFGSWIDPDFDTNYAWAAYHAGRRSWTRLFKKLWGFTVYVVYQPGQDSVGALIAHIQQKFGQVSPWMCIMVDVESWPGSNYSITGDHSSEISEQLNRAGAALKNRRRVWVYFNNSDGITIYPNRVPWARVILAAYSNVRPSLQGAGKLLGWQYTDGSGNWPSPSDLPTSSSPFGKCDHDVFLDKGPKQMVEEVFGSVQPGPDIHRPQPGHHPRDRRIKIYTVRRGDTLGGIAQKFGMTLQTVERLNLRRHPNLAANPDLIRVGEKIRVIVND